LLAAEACVDDHPASTRARLAGGLWLTLRAARLAPDEPGPTPGNRGAATIVVTIGEVSAAERLELFARDRVTVLIAPSAPERRQEADRGSILVTPATPGRVTRQVTLER
jgi:hypothetical protein